MHFAGTKNVHPAGVAMCTAMPDESGGRSLPAIVLAAGLSTRMKAFKPLLRLSGELLIHRVLGCLRESGVIGEILVVTGHLAAEIEAAVGTRGARTVFNERFADGEMLSSVQTGIRALPADGRGFLLAFADQPVRPHSVRAIVEGFQSANAPLSLPLFGGKRGHPVVISQSLAPAILALASHQTLRAVVQEHLSRAAMIPVDDPWVLEDLDTPEDFARAQSRLGAEPAEVMGSVSNGGGHAHQVGHG